jgi:hypothetical protein
MSLHAYLFNTAWMLRCRAEWNRFTKDTVRVRETQTDSLKRLLHQNRQSQFGVRYRFASIETVEEYQSRVPIMQSNHLAEAVHQISEGKQQVLTCEPVTLLQPTSGSTSATKLIPYTQSLRYEYQRMVSAWIGNLYWTHPSVRHGQAYWSISPAGQTRKITASGIAIGFDDDTEYLAKLERWMAKHLLAVPASIARESDIDRFRYITLLSLLRTRDLSLISIWSPTFLSSLMEQLATHGAMLLRDVRNGTLFGSLPSEAYPWLRRPLLDRALQLEQILSNASPSTFAKQIWPKLAMVSCWMDGSSSRLAARLQDQMEGVPFQGKGLLATEGCVSFPVVGRSGCALAIRSHFYEFQSYPETNGQTYLADQLVQGEQYSVIITTGGGLWRYALNDVIEVVDRWNDCPMIRFVGRAGQTSDMVGEKLHESFVKECIDRVLFEHKIEATFAMLEAVPAGAEGADRCGYRWQLETRSCIPNEVQLAVELDERLQENVHYGYARKLGQLAQIVLDPRAGPPGQAWREFEEKQCERGLSLGTIKPTSLSIRVSNPG